MFCAKVTICSSCLLHLITPFILGSMSVGLNILIRHLFTNIYEFGLWLGYHGHNYLMPLEGFAS